MKTWRIFLFTRLSIRGGPREARGAAPKLASQHAAALLDWNGHLLDDLQAKAFESGNVHRGIREQTDALDAKVRKDLARLVRWRAEYGRCGLANLRARATPGAEPGAHQGVSGKETLSKGSIAASATGARSISNPREVLWR